MTKDKPKTPRSDALEAHRRALGARRTPAYGDALALCRQLEAELVELRAKQPKEGAFYQLGGQMDDVVPGHVLQETRPVIWCHFEQKWIE
jgi:hypothetical protein